MSPSLPTDLRPFHKPHTAAAAAL